MKTSKVIRVLGINGSPRAGGNADILLDKALEGAESKGAISEKIILNKLKFVPCQECSKIKSGVNCAIKDDMAGVYKKIKAADAVIIASPIFFGSLTAQTKMMVDRFQCAWHAKYVLKKDAFSEKKTGAFIAVSMADRIDFFENARSIVRNLFATINIKYADELFFPGLEKKGDALKHPDLLRKAYSLGENIIEAVIKEGK